MKKQNRILTLVWPLGIGVILLFVPLLRDVHLESAILVGTVFCFIAAIKSSKNVKQSDQILILTLLGYQGLIFLPLLIFGIFNNCLTLAGIGLWILIPIPSTVFGASIGRFIRLIKFPLPKSSSIISLLLIAAGILVYEFFTLPQVYYFNHVWGSWPGPIYDEEIRLTSSLIWFRFSTILWAVLLWNLPSIGKSAVQKIVVLICAISLIVILIFQPQLGISTPRSFLKTQLPSKIETEHFHLYFDATNFSDAEKYYWAARHEFHFNQIVTQLEIDWPENRVIESFVYANAWQKKELVGAKFTSYVPVWLEQDQLHIAKEHLEPVLKHEMVHVISKQFGNDLINASWSIGLIEGVAEAIAKDASNISTLDQIIAAEDPLPTSEEMANALTIQGFYASASSISYTTTGSFVNYLLDNYPVENFKRAYPNSDFEASYELPFDTLVSRWIRQLPIESLDSLDTQVSQAVFSQQSLFQVPCPRKIHPVLQGLDELRYHESFQDTASALSTINELNSSYSHVLIIQQLWASYQLRTGNSNEVLKSDLNSDTLLAPQLLLADAHFQSGNMSDAALIREQLKNDSLYSNDQNAQNSFLVRSDSVTWKAFANARYNNQLVDGTDYPELPTPLQWLLINVAIQENASNYLAYYSSILLEKPVDLDWFDVQISMIDELIYQGAFDLAQDWISLLHTKDLRLRYLERLNDQEEWLEFNQEFEELINE